MFIQTSADIPFLSFRIPLMAHGQKSLHKMDLLTFPKGDRVGNKKGQSREHVEHFKHARLSQHFKLGDSFTRNCGQAMEYIVM